LAAFTEWLVRRRRSPAPFPWIRLTLSAGAVAVLPLLVLVFGRHVHAARDPFLAAIHTHISEFKPLLWRIGVDSMTWSASFGAFPLFLVLALPLLFVRRVGCGVRAPLVFVLAPIVFITAMHFYQIRWGTLGGGAFIALGAVVFSVYWSLLGRTRWKTAARTAMATAFLVLFVWAPCDRAKAEVRTALLPPEKRIVNEQEALHLVMRDIAETIRRYAGERPVVLLSSPNSSLLLGTMGDFKTIGTLYWENIEGLRAAAGMFAAQTDDEALRRLQERGVTHIALIDWENFIEPYVRILMPEGGDAAIMNSFGFKALFRRVLPVWCRPIPYPRHPWLDALHLNVLLLEVVPTQSIPEALFHIGRYHRAEGRPEEAEQVFRQILAEQPQSNVVRMELAALLTDTGRAPEAVREWTEALRVVQAGPARETLLFQAAHRLLMLNAAPEAVALLQAFPPAIEAGRPEGAQRLNLLAWILAVHADERVRNPERALELLAEIERAGATDQVPWGDTQAAALAALGRFDEAMATLERHMAGLNPAEHPPEAMELLQRRLALYREHRPWIESFGSPARNQAASETDAGRHP